MLLLSVLRNFLESPCEKSFRGLRSQNGKRIVAVQGSFRVLSGEWRWGRRPESLGAVSATDYSDWFSIPTSENRSFIRSSSSSLAVARARRESSSYVRVIARFRQRRSKKNGMKTPHQIQKRRKTCQSSEGKTRFAKAETPRHSHGPNGGAKGGQKWGSTLMS